MDFRLPELGEGISDATVVAIAVKPGQTVAAGDTIIEVETDKASMPIPATSAGTITELKVKQGDKVKVGAVIAILGGAGAAPAAKAAPVPAPAKAAEAAKPAAPTMPAAPAVAADYAQKLPALGEGIDGGTIVGVSVKAGDAIKTGQEIFTIETDKASMPVPSDVDGTVKEIKVKVGDKVAVGGLLAVISSTGATAPSAGAATPAAPAKSAVVSAPPVSDNGAPGILTTTGLVPAGPATRRYAREHSVALNEVPGTARGGRVTVDDVKSHIRKKMSQPAGSGGSGGVAVPPMPDFSKYGPIEKKPLSNLR